MPGMIDTLLNLGLCNGKVGGQMRQTGNPTLAWNACGRLEAACGDVVAGAPAANFEGFATALIDAGYKRELDFAEFRSLTRQLLEGYAEGVRRPFPQGPAGQRRRRRSGVRVRMQAIDNINAASAADTVVILAVALLEGGAIEPERRHGQRTAGGTGRGLDQRGLNGRHLVGRV